MKKIRVAIDISPLKSGHRFRGIGFYTKNLIDALQELIKNNKKYARWRINLIEDREEKIESFDLVHYPYFDPFFPTLPRRRRVPLIVTVHDLTPLKFPHYYPPGIRGKIHWFGQKSRLKRVDAIITDSQSSKKDIIKVVGYPEERIYVIYLAPALSFKKLEKNNLSHRLMELKSKVKQKYHLPETFVLYVGDVNWNKNVPGLVKTCEKIGVPLIIVGKQAVSKNFNQRHIENRDLVWLQKRAKKSKFVSLLGFVPAEELIAIYSLAAVYCQPSFYEGFGLPVLEAMAYGAPVVCSNQGSLPEVGGVAAIYFNPYQKGEMQEKLAKVLNDKKLRSQLIRAGKKRARKFSWQKTAQQTMVVYRKVLSS